MSLQEQMIAANVRNWLADLAIGAKAQNTEMLCAVCDRGDEWRYIAHTYYDAKRDDVPTVYVHNIKSVAEAAELELHHRDFVKGDYHYPSFNGENFIVFQGVKFSDMILNTNKEEK